MRLRGPFLALPVILTKTLILLLFQKTLREKFNGVNALKLLFFVTDAATNKLECLSQSILRLMVHLYWLLGAYLRVASYNNPLKGVTVRWL
jgi:hypothetical protein